MVDFDPCSTRAHARWRTKARATTGLRLDRVLRSRVPLSVTLRGRRGHGSLGAISLTGRFVTYASFEANHVREDRNRALDVFVRDRDADRDGVFDEPGAVRTRPISLSTGGRAGNAASRAGTVSPNGRYVAFVSDATNLVPGDLNGTADVFLGDRDVDEAASFDEAGSVRTTLVTAGISGQSANGRSDEAEADWVLYFHRFRFPDHPAVVGRSVAFTSFASDLVEGDENSVQDVFVHTWRR